MYSIPTEVAPLKPNPSAMNRDDDLSEEDTSEYLTKPGSTNKPSSAATESRSSKPVLAKRPPNADDANDDEDDEEDSSDDDEDDDAPEGAYDPAEYEHLKVDNEVKEIFRYITKYTPQSLDLEYRLKPFIPDFIPAVGDIDAFLKIPRPDGLPDNLGLTVLDEPVANQSDPSVLHHRLQAFSKLKKQRENIVQKIPNLHKDSKGVKDLESWLNQMSDLTTSLPSQSVHYTKAMPDVDLLMREWPEDFEAGMQELGGEDSICNADLDCDLETYIDLLCTMLDIPVHEKNGKPNRLQSLHVLFNLYLEIKNSSFFDAT